MANNTTLVARRLIVIWALILALVTIRRPSRPRLAVSSSASMLRGQRQSSHAYFLLLSHCRAPTLGMEIPFFVSGFVLSQEGANGHLLFSVNDQSMVVDFPKTRTTICPNNSTTKSALPPSFGLALFS